MESLSTDQRFFSFLIFSSSTLLSFVLLFLHYTLLFSMLLPFSTLLPLLLVCHESFSPPPSMPQASCKSSSCGWNIILLERQHSPRTQVRMLRFAPWSLAGTLSVHALPSICADSSLKSACWDSHPLHWYRSTTFSL